MPNVKMVDSRMLRNSFYKNTIYYLNNINSTFIMYSNNLSDIKKSSFIGRLLKKQ